MGDPAEDAGGDDEHPAAAPSADGDDDESPSKAGDSGADGEPPEDGGSAADESPAEGDDGATSAATDDAAGDTEDGVGETDATDGADDDEETDQDEGEEDETDAAEDGGGDENGDGDDADGGAPDPIGPTDWRPTIDDTDVGDVTEEDVERSPEQPDETEYGFEVPEEFEWDDDDADTLDPELEDTEARTGPESDVETGGLIDADVKHAPDDEEQPLEAHITEMIHRFLAVAVAMGGVALIALLWSDDLINFLWYSFLGPGAPLCPGNECPQTFRPHLYHPLSLVLARLKIAALVGFVVGLPVAVYQTYLFMRPGLYPRERRYYLAAVPTSLVLAAVGVLFAYFLVLPALFSYFMGYSTRAAEAALGLAETFNIIVIMLGFFALVFQIPLLVMLAIMMGVTTRRWLESRRLYFWMGFGGVAFIFSPDPTGMAPLLVALTMIGLFEGTLTLLRWTGKDSPVLAPEPMRARRPYAWVLALVVGYLVSDMPLPTGYFDRFPPVVTDALADFGLTGATPLLVGVGIVAVFEIGFYLLRRFGDRQLRLKLALYRVRRPVWVAAVIVGYLASPDPAILETLRATTLEPRFVGAVVLGLIVLYEIAVQLVVWRRG